MFDGHSGFAAAQYLSEHLYDCFSDAIDEGAYGPECSIDGVKTGHLSSPETVYPTRAAICVHADETTVKDTSKPVCGCQSACFCKSQSLFPLLIELARVQRGRQAASVALWSLAACLETASERRTKSCSPGCKVSSQGLHDQQ